MLALLTCASAFSIGCSSSDKPTAKTDADYKQDVQAGMHDTLLVGIQDMRSAAEALQAAAPSGHAWDRATDAQALTDMKAAWVKARVAYEHIEGAIAPLFPDLDAAVDARYDDFLSQLGTTGDQDLFDDQGVTGLHAIERILYVDVTPSHVIEGERVLPGYKAAAIPGTAEEADEFKNKLCARLVADIKTLESQWSPQKIDIGGAFQGLVSLMNEQREKVTKAATFEEESRYSQRTMADLRANLEGTTSAYQLFAPWLASHAGDDGKATDAKIRTGLASLASVYTTVQGDAIPQPPATWAAEHPTAADLQTDFGKLYTSVKAAVDPTVDGSIVFEMNDAARVLGFREFVEGK